MERRYTTATVHGPEIAPQPAASRRVTGAVMACAVGAAAVSLNREPASLAAALPCPGLLDAVAVLGARTFQTTPVGLWLSWSGAVVLAVAVAAFASVARRTTGHWSAYATALAFGLTAAFAPLLAPPDAAAIAMAAVVIDALLRIGTAGRPLQLLIVCLPLMSAITPTTAIGLAAVAAWVGVITAPVRRRTLTAAGMAALTLAAPAGVAALLPGLPPSMDTHQSACVAAMAMVPDPGRVWAALREVILGPAGGYGVALAALGAFVLRQRVVVRRSWPIVAFALLPLLSLGGSTAQARPLTPALVAWWLLIAMGLVSVVRSCRTNPGGYVAMALLAGLLPGLHLLQPGRVLVAADVPLGHERLSARDMARLLDALPDNAILVTEDAVTDILIRATRGRWSRTGKVLKVVGRDSSGLGNLARDERVSVFALPSAQADLQRLGFELVAAPGLSQPGIRQVQAGGPCVQVNDEWREVSAALASGLTALGEVSGGPRGSIELYLAGPSSLAPHVAEAAKRGVVSVLWEGFDRPAAGEEVRRRELAQRGAPEHAHALSLPRMVRADITPGPNAAEWTLLDLGGAPPYAVARAIGQRGRVSLCRAFPYDRLPLGDPER